MALTDWQASYSMTHRHSSLGCLAPASTLPSASAPRPCARWITPRGLCTPSARCRDPHLGTRSELALVHEHVSTRQRLHCVPVLDNEPVLNAV